MLTKLFDWFCVVFLAACVLAIPLMYTAVAVGDTGDWGLAIAFLVLILGFTSLCARGIYVLLRILDK